MPTYQYVCTECRSDLEAVQAFTDDPLTECPSCGGRLRKVFKSVGIVFKGSGFYRNDSRETPKESGAGKAEKSNAKEGAKSASKPDTTSGKSDAKPSSGGPDKSAGTKETKSDSAKKPGTGSSTAGSAA